MQSISPQIGVGATPNFIYAKNDLMKEALILDHMGQYVWTEIKKKKDGLDLSHVVKVMDWLAKFHGLSYVLLNNHPDGPEGWLKENSYVKTMSLKLKELGQEKENEMNEALKELFLPENVIKRCEWLEKAKDDKKYSKWMKSVFENGVTIPELRKSLHEPKSGRVTINTINHMDLWFNNILAKYDEENDELEDVLVLDFQNCGYCNVGYDLAFFMLTSTTKEFRVKYLDQVLESYLISLKSTVLNASGQDLQDYTLDHLKKDYKNHLGIGLTFCMHALPMILCSLPDNEITFDNSPKREETIESDENDSDCLKKYKVQMAILTKDQNVQTRYMGVIDDMMEIDFEQLLSIQRS